MNCDQLNELRSRLGYTQTPLMKTICENLTSMSTDNGDRAIDIIQNAIPYIFDFDFPIHDENHTQELETKIIKNYYFRGICCESVEEWKLRLSNKLNLIMPYYNEMYKSVAYLADFMDDVDYSRTVSEDTLRTGVENTKSTQETTGNVNAKSSENDINTAKTSGKNVDRFSNTPQGSLEGIENNEYLTTADIQDTNGTSQNVGSNQRDSNSETSSSASGTVDSVNTDNGKRNMTERVKGKMGTKSKAEMVMEYRKAVMNIDNDIVNRLYDMFMGVYSAWD